MEGERCSRCKRISDVIFEYEDGRKLCLRCFEETEGIRIFLEPPLPVTGKEKSQGKRGINKSTKLPGG